MIFWIVAIAFQIVRIPTWFVHVVVIDKHRQALVAKTTSVNENYFAIPSTNRAQSME